MTPVLLCGALSCAAHDGGPTSTPTTPTAATPTAPGKASAPSSAASSPSTEPPAGPLSGICPQDSIGNCAVCPSYTALGGQGRAVLNLLAQGSFTAPSRAEALVHISGCEADENKHAGIALVTRDDHGWHSVAYAAGATADRCTPMLRDGKAARVLCTKSDILEERTGWSGAVVLDFEAGLQHELLGGRCRGEEVLGAELGEGQEIRVDVRVGLRRMIFGRKCMTSIRKDERTEVLVYEPSDGGFSPTPATRKLMEAVVPPGEKAGGLEGMLPSTTTLSLREADGQLPRSSP